MKYTKEEKIQRYMRRIIGILVLTSAILAFYVSQWWLLLTGFVGLNLLQFGFSDWCLLQTMLKKLVKS